MPRPSYEHGASAIPLIGETIGAHLDRIAARYPAREAVVSCHQGVRLTYDELRRATDEFARGLMALGVEHGDRVGIWSTNSVEWVIAQFATPKIGAILVNINPAYRTSEVAYVLQQSGVSVLLTQVRHKTSEYARMIAEVLPTLSDLRQVALCRAGTNRAPPEKAPAISASPMLPPQQDGSGEQSYAKRLRSIFVMNDYTITFMWTVPI